MFCDAVIRPHVVVHRHLKPSFREPSAETRSLSALAPRQLQMSILMTTTRSLELTEVPPIDLGHEAIIKDRCTPLKKQRCVSADPWGQHIYIYILFMLLRVESFLAQHISVVPLGVVKNHSSPAWAGRALLSTPHVGCSDMMF